MSIGPIRFYTDEHVARTVVNGLRLRGIDVRTVHQAGLLGADDEAHLDVARTEGRVIVTQDAGFLRMHARSSTHAGIAFAAQGTPVSRIVRGLLLIHDVLEPGEMQGHVEFL